MKNRVNSELLMIKKKELEMSTPSSFSVPMFRSDMTPEETYAYKVETEELCNFIFEGVLNRVSEPPLYDDDEEEDDAYESGGDDETFPDEPPSMEKSLAIAFEVKSKLERLKDDNINDFFKRYAEVRSFKNRSALCHRQENVLVKSLLIMDNFMSGYVVTPKIVKYQDDHERILEEIKKRSRRGRNWVIPYTFPVQQDAECRHSAVVKLLTVPDSNSTRQLTTGLRFSTMACERRFFADVSHSLGFVATPSSCEETDAPTPYLFEKPQMDIYERIIKPKHSLKKCLLPRFRARCDRETYESSLDNLAEHTSFFAGLWALCSRANLENSVLSAVVSRPQEASFLLRGGDDDDADAAKTVERVRHAIDSIGKRRDMSLTRTFLEFVGCVELTTIGNNQDFYSDLTERYKSASDSNGVHLWTLFDVIKRCFNDSLPVDWRKYLGGDDKHLNMVPSVPNTDESGAVFETCRFVLRCSEIILGSAKRRLGQTLTREEWHRLFTKHASSWTGRMAVVYEKVMNTNDSRTTENFINSSSFLSNNNIGKKISLNTTKSEKIRFAC
ncbi:hypothetical protein Pcinc_011774 [Petrolisthes cinctipes]|uniref:Uncharacterized protein n=1 Tax=Petrolisthes cinctipes TaxID=88211 RepID=A0AAE1G0C2_PETCI|nr:hypothetical protein Pcinc_011774 [Petrolisthes cinctipes]